MSIKKIQVLKSFSFNWIPFFYIELFEFFILHINLLSDMSLANIFSCSIGCLFILLMVYFHCAKGF